MKQDKVERQLEEKAIRFYRTFNTEVGAKVLEELRQEFCSLPAMAPDTHLTYYRLGQRDVIEYIDKLIAYRGDE